MAADLVCGRKRSFRAGRFSGRLPAIAVFVAFGDDGHESRPGTTYIEHGGRNDSRRDPPVQPETTVRLPALPKHYGISWGDDSEPSESVSALCSDGPVPTEGCASYR